MFYSTLTENTKLAMLIVHTGSLAMCTFTLRFMLFICYVCSVLHCAHYRDPMVTEVRCSVCKRTQAEPFQMMCI